MPLNKSQINLYKNISEWYTLTNTCGKYGENIKYVDWSNPKNEKQIKTLIFII